MHYHYGPYSMKNSDTNICTFNIKLYHTPYVYERNMLTLNTITDLTVHEYIHTRPFFPLSFWTGPGYEINTSLATQCHILYLLEIYSSDVLFQLLVHWPLSSHIPTAQEQEYWTEQLLQRTSLETGCDYTANTLIGTIIKIERRTSVIY